MSTTLSATRAGDTLKGRVMGTYSYINSRGEAVKTDVPLPGIEVTLIGKANGARLCAVTDPGGRYSVDAGGVDEPGGWLVHAHDPTDNWV